MLKKAKSNVTRRGATTVAPGPSALRAKPGGKVSERRAQLIIDGLGEVGLRRGDRPARSRHDAALERNPRLARRRGCQ